MSKFEIKITSLNFELIPNQDGKYILAMIFNVKEEARQWLDLLASEMYSLDLSLLNNGETLVVFKFTNYHSNHIFRTGHLPVNELLGKSGYLLQLYVMDDSNMSAQPFGSSIPQFPLSLN